MAFITAGACILITYRMVGRLRPGSVNRGYRAGQIVSASLLSLSHGTNDAQKTMGIITLALIAHGSLSGPSPDPPLWVIVSAASAIALGTYTGGWRIIRTMGSKIYKMDPAQGFAAQGGGAAVLLTASHLGFPLSTTHSITGAVLGAGAAKSVSAVRWGLAGNIAVAWVLTLPAAAAVGAVDVRREPDLRHRRARAAAHLGQRAHAHRGDVRQAAAPRPAGRRRPLPAPADS